MTPADNTNTPEENTADKIKKTEVYKALEAMISIEVVNLNELIGKRKDAKTKVSRELYDKKIIKVRDKTLKYMLQLNKLTGGNVEDVLKEIEQEKMKDVEAEGEAEQC